MATPDTLVPVSEPKLPNDAEKLEEFLTHIITEKSSRVMKKLKRKWQAGCLTRRHLNMIPPRHGGTDMRFPDAVYDRLMLTSKLPGLTGESKILMQRWTNNRSFNNKDWTKVQAFIQS
jgi:hypothetical protein